MKRPLLFLSSLIALSTPLIGQHVNITHATPATLHQPNPPQLLAADTITTYFNRATGFYTLTAGGAGYVLGTSNVTTETAMHYDDAGVQHVTELMVYFIAKEVMGNADMVTANVYQAGPDSLPTTLLGTGQVSVTAIDTSGFPTFIPISNYTAQAGGFVVSIAYGSIDDSVAIYSTNPTTGNGGPDGAGERRCSQNTVAGWFHAADVWTIASVPYDADALIIPIVDITSSTGPALIDGISFSAAYPSPAQNEVAFNVTTATQQEFTLTVYSSTGAAVSVTNYSVNGSQQISLNVESWSIGTYYYVISSANGSMGSKFQVSR